MSNPDSPQPLGRALAKHLAAGVVSFGATKFIKNAMSDFTRFDGDDLIVNVVAGSIGFVAAYKLEPLTDKAVDVTFDFVSAQHKKYKNRRKDDTTE